MKLHVNTLGFGCTPFTATLRAVALGREEISVGGTETWAIVLKRFFPGLLSWGVRKMKFSGGSSTRP